MKSSLSFKLFGIPIMIHWSMVLVLVMAFMHFDSMSLGLYVYSILFAIVLLHELGHAFGAHLIGSGVDKIVLIPIGGVAVTQKLAAKIDSAWKEFVVISMGPAVNLALLLVTIVAYLLIPSEIFSNPYVHWPIAINIGLLVFNMIPISPLDGGQIMHSLIWGLTRSKTAATKYSGLVGIILGCLLISVLLAVGDIIGSIIIGLCVAISIGAWLHPKAMNGEKEEEKSLQNLRKRLILITATINTGQQLLQILKLSLIKSQLH